ncbi:uncharacterized protein TrAtP1_004241 [Trichoderma atroviride]|uniref:Actin-like ATPase domain-containing protein n=1 Tax=Hypocrea atroviridis (strain ATCC 20476 / IMI 206040) TaxID=452589 RepID=G9P826_HYPAI|nr:uncharacterized protein TRIATDRAFT_30156 [Trichoderma atroviride IMI 206040]EHK40875.1 hypothetical protein TRIATDRAFT_30156 [Trichoderma atroviride IMI 206040]UKZ63013.1 hypothetical protein TrAtP1_004241 [Trichoderma atroviride]
MASSTQNEANTDGDSSQSKNEEPFIALGIDFGTTYSGVAWAISTRPANINMITSWDSAKYHCSDKEKTPSIMSYEQNGKVLWGYSVSDKKSSIEWSKLCLLDEDDIPNDVSHSTQLQAAQAALKQQRKSVVDVISDYLRHLWKHSIINIRRAIGGQLVDLCRFKVVATIPAIWPIYAQMRMHEAIEKAGILSTRKAGQTILEFLPEPEAAALATLKGISTYNQANMEVGDHFVVCDAGGGTVDIITYTVVELNPIKVRESVKGDGKLCGATFLDERFLEILREKLDQISPDTWKTLEETGALGRIINNDWENGIKPQFRNTDQHWMIQIPVKGPKRTHDEFRFSDIKLDVKDIQRIFKPIVAEIKNLVDNQVKAIKDKYNKEPKFVVLVGGFGRQPFLFTEMQDALNRRNGLVGTVEVLQSQGAEPWTAVCRGAVIRGLELSDSTRGSTVMSRISRMSYGVKCYTTPWNAKEHDIRDKEWSDIHQAYRAANQTSWFVRIGETIPVGQSISKGYRTDLEMPVTHYSTKLIYSTSATPPKRCDKTVKKLCRLQWSTVPEFNRLPTWVNSKGRTIRQFCFDTNMTSNGVTLDFEIIYKGQSVASKNIDIDYGHCGALASSRN